MQRKVTVLFLSVLMGCSASKQTPQEKWRPVYRAQIGANRGGITENTDMKVIPDASVDAFSGATKYGFNVSGRVILPLPSNNIETGLDFMQNRQTFTYNDAVRQYFGTREIRTSQIMFPVVYNIHFFRQNTPEGLLQLKLGYLAQFNVIRVASSATSLPGYSTKSFSNGFTLGASIIPFRLKNGAKIGFFLEGYRGSQIYEDFYNNVSFDMPGSSFIKYGIIYEFNL